MDHPLTKNGLLGTNHSKPARFMSFQRGKNHHKISFYGKGYDDMDIQSTTFLNALNFCFLNCLITRSCNKRQTGNAFPVRENTPDSLSSQRESSKHCRQWKFRHLAVALLWQIKRYIFLSLKFQLGSACSIKST